VLSWLLQNFLPVVERQLCLGRLAEGGILHLEQEVGRASPRLRVEQVEVVDLVHLRCIKDKHGGILYLVAEVSL
jgi:hypothetical protein